MDKQHRSVAVLIAEDDDDDYRLTQRAFAEAQFEGKLYRVKDGDELMKFLLEGRLDAPADRAHHCLLLLLDLNMPRKDGRQALKEIKSHPGLKTIPVVVLTTSGSDADIKMAYELGANSYVRKPDTYKDFIEFIRSLKTYWLEVAALPWQASPGRVA